MGIKETLKEGEKGLNAYRNLIGLGIILTILLGCALIVYSSSEQQKIAEECGFDDGKVKCVCTGDAWNKYQDDLDIKSSQNLQFELKSIQNP